MPTVSQAPLQPLMDNLESQTCVAYARSSQPRVATHFIV